MGLAMIIWLGEMLNTINGFLLVIFILVSVSGAGYLVIDANEKYSVYQFNYSISEETKLAKKEEINTIMFKKMKKLCVISSVLGLLFTVTPNRDTFYAMVGVSVAENVLHEMATKLDDSEKVKRLSSIIDKSLSLVEVKLDGALIDKEQTDGKK